MQGSEREGLACGYEQPKNAAGAVAAAALKAAVTAHYEDRTV
jgi:hypothetical protein